MTTHDEDRGSTTRRGFLTAAAAAGAAAWLGRPRQAMSALADVVGDPAAGKPNSVINGVRIGCITYSYRPRINSAEETLAALLKDGLSEVELMDTPIKAFAGIGGGGKPAPGSAPAAPTDNQREAQLAKCRDLRKLYNDAGVNIHIHKTPFGKTDEDVEFNFLIAKALGAVAITTERDEALAKRVAPLAEKHQIYVAFHNHQNNFPSLDEHDRLLDIGKYIAFNLDVGHYVGGTKGKSPIPLIEKYHDRIVNLHLKDKTNEGRNMAWGKGQTPIKEVLQLLKKEKWPIYADIEVEYPIPKESDPVAEVGICLQYCREALA
jgi:sugar phosphate isomerase/epimerase